MWWLTVAGATPTSFASLVAVLPPTTDHRIDALVEPSSAVRWSLPVRPAARTRDSVRMGNASAGGSRGHRVMQDEVARDQHQASAVQVQVPVEE